MRTLVTTLLLILLTFPNVFSQSSRRHIDGIYRLSAGSQGGIALWIVDGAK